MLGLVCAMSIAAHAQDAPKHELTPEQKALMQEMLAKYDTNKDGKIDKEEREAISPEDKAKMEKAGIWPHHHKKPAADTSSSTDTNSPAK